MGSLVRTVLCALALLPLAACERTKHDADLGTLDIDAGRLGVIIDRATAGLDLDPRKAQQSPDADATRRLEIDRAQRDTALKLLILRNRLLHEDRISEGDARASHWPSWILLPPESSMAPEELRERQAWLTKETASLTAQGCEIGRTKSGNASYCSVD